MATTTVRNLDEDVRRRLQQRTGRNGRSMESEARAILGASVSERGSSSTGSTRPARSPWIWSCRRAACRGSSTCRDRARHRRLVRAVACCTRCAGRGTDAGAGGCRRHGRLRRRVADGRLPTTARRASRAVALCDRARARRARDPGLRCQRRPRVRVDAGVPSCGRQAAVDRGRHDRGDRAPTAPRARRGTRSTSRVSGWCWSIPGPSDDWRVAERARVRRAAGLRGPGGGRHYVFGPVAHGCGVVAGGGGEQCRL